MGLVIVVPGLWAPYLGRPGVYAAGALGRVPDVARIAAKGARTSLKTREGFVSLR